MHIAWLCSRHLMLYCIIYTKEIKDLIKSIICVLQRLRWLLLSLRTYAEYIADQFTFPSSEKRDKIRKSLMFDINKWYNIHTIGNKTRWAVIEQRETRWESYRLLDARTILLLNLHHRKDIIANVCMYV